MLLWTVGGLSYEEMMERGREFVERNRAFVESCVHESLCDVLHGMGEEAAEGAAPPGGALAPTALNLCVGLPPAAATTDRVERGKAQRDLWHGDDAAERIAREFALGACLKAECAACGAGGCPRQPRERPAPARFRTADGAGRAGERVRFRRSPDSLPDLLLGDFVSEVATTTARNSNSTVTTTTTTTTATTTTTTASTTAAGAAPAAAPTVLRYRPPGGAAEKTLHLRGAAGRELADGGTVFVEDAPCASTCFTDKERKVFQRRWEPWRDAHVVAADARAIVVRTAGGAEVTLSAKELSEGRAQVDSYAEAAAHAFNTAFAERLLRELRSHSLLFADAAARIEGDARKWVSDHWGEIVADPARLPEWARGVDLEELEGERAWNGVAGYCPLYGGPRLDDAASGCVALLGAWAGAAEDAARWQIASATLEHARIRRNPVARGGKGFAEPCQPGVNTTLREAYRFLRYLDRRMAALATDTRLQQHLANPHADDECPGAIKTLADVQTHTPPHRNPTTQMPQYAFRVPGQHGSNPAGSAMDPDWVKACQGRSLRAEAMLTAGLVPWPEHDADAAQAPDGRADAADGARLARDEARAGAP
eukprot:gene2334-18721_t